jgi:hypothetical protein
MVMNEWCGTNALNCWECLKALELWFSLNFVVACTVLGSEILSMRIGVCCQVAEVLYNS